MNILDVLTQLRDDLKEWTTNNILSLKNYVDRTRFSGKYDDLTNKPDIDAKIDNAKNTLQESINEINKDIETIDDSLSEANENIEQIMNVDIANMQSSITDLNNVIYPHESNVVVHITNEERATWNNKAEKSEIPTKVSELDNDANYLTQHQSLAGLASETYVDNAIADLVDSSPEAMNTLKELSSALKDDPNHTETMLTEIGKKANTADLHKVATSGSYDDLINKPTIPTANDLLSDTQKNQISTAYTHSQAAHAPSNAQKNSDITKAEIEAKLIGSITSHNHDGQYCTKSELENIASRAITTAEIDSAFSAVGL